MRSYILPVTLIACLGTVSAGFAATTAAAAAKAMRPAAASQMQLSTTAGVIKTFSSRHRTVTLADGTVFHYASGLKHPAFKVGEKISVNWLMSGKEHHAKSFSVAG